MKVKVFSILALLAVLALVVGLALPGCVRVSTPEKINQLIEKKGYNWEAGKTSVSNLTLEQKKMLCGVKLEPELKMQPVGVEIVRALPAAFDWRDRPYSDYTTPIRDQGHCGSCVAFGTLGAFESILEILEDSPEVNPDLSEEYLFFCGGGSCGGGWYPSSAAGFLQDTGTPDEVCWPYEDHDAACTMCSGTCEDCESGVAGSCYCSNVHDGTHHGGRAINIDSWTYLLSDAEQIKNSIVSNGPVVAVMKVYEDFFDYTGGCYKHVSGSQVGLHCITIVGYDDDMDCGGGGGCGCSCNGDGSSQGAWIAKNSWGTGWGESGWFNIAYGECGIEGAAGYNPIQLVKEATNLYIRDNTGDTGDTPTSGTFWLSPDLIVRNADEGAEPAAWSNQSVIGGADNWIYVKVHNIGANTGGEIEVRLYVTDYPGTEFMYPWDYENEISTSPVTISSLAPGADAVAKFKWLAAEIPSAAEMAHPCLLAEVRCTQDINAAQWGICAPFSGTHVWENNNLAQRNITIIEGKGGKSFMFPIDIGNIHSVPREYSVLVVDRSQTPKTAEITLNLGHMSPISLVGATDNVGLSGTLITISPEAAEAEIRIPLSQERTRVYLTFTVPASAQGGEEYTVDIMQKDDQNRIVGGITLVVKVVFPY
jgi:C1A family cysteine protease